jgi:pimeloyl-ACP methyl ester carboxylesterase
MTRVLAAFLLLWTVLTPGSLAGLQAGGQAVQPIELQTSSGAVHGTLLLPSGDGPFPAALIIAGSGPTDRDGNSAALPGQNNSLRLLAEALAEHGIASVRYDKRGIGESAPGAPQEADLRFDTYVDDAAAWVQRLREDSRFSTVSIIGHSEGSLIGMVAAQRTPVDAFVSIAGVARPAFELLREQLLPQLPRELWEASERILNSLVIGELAGEVPPALFALYRPSDQPYLISWFRYNPVEEIAQLDVPVLIVHGTTDIQVSTEDAQRLHLARPDAELAVIEGMNHILKSVSLDPIQQQASYSDPMLPVAPDLIERVSAFLQSLGARTGEQ